MIDYRMRNIALYPKTREFIISKELFEGVKLAKNTLDLAGEIEHIYELIIMNYLDLENEFLSIITESSVREKDSYREFFDIKLRLNRRIVNLLTTTRMYFDQVPSKLRKIDADGSLKKAFRSEASRRYDGSLEYRFMEALRNHVQHGGLPVDSGIVGGTWKGSASEGKLERSAAFHATKDEILKNKSFGNAKVRGEMPEKVDLIVACRKYIGAMGGINIECRQLLNQKITESRLLIESVIESHNNLYQGNGKSWLAESFEVINGSEEVRESVAMFLTWDDLRVGLVSASANLSSLGDAYVTGEIRE